MPSSASGGDRRISELTELALSGNLLNQATRQFIRDPYRALNLETGRHGQGSILHTGVVVWSLPQLNWYRVQLDGVGGTVGCTLAGESSFLPVGVRTSGTLPPYSSVVVWVPPGRSEGLILESFPLPQQDPRLTCSDWILQGSQSGNKREDVYRQPFKLLYRSGGISDYSANRPADATTLEWGKFAETGVGLSLDAFLATIRVNEMCGLWLHYWDSHTRLAGLNLDIVSAAHELIARDDEGENRYIEYGNVYPWETLGLYAPDEKLHAETPDQEVLFSAARGKLDLDEDHEDAQSIARYQEFGGYLGQGRLRLVMVPYPGESVRHYRDDPHQRPDLGVFRESIGLDGSYLLQSAKQLIIGKQLLIPVPKEMRLPEDQKSGDDARKDNYRFSGKFGGEDTEAHAVGDIAAEDEPRSLLQAAALADLLAYNGNWRALHPFHYHREDYRVPEEQELVRHRGGPVRAQDVLDFAELSEQAAMSYPQAKKIRVDHRYGEVEYTQRQASLAFLEDGGIVLQDGYGSRIIFRGGHITLDCPGDIQLAPGRAFTLLAGDDIVLRARNSVDVTAGKKDLRLKAERNCQILGGNASSGGVLIESKAPAFAADFENKRGEDVQSGGILLKAPNSAIAGWAGDIYLRTGGSESGLRSGRIVLDAGKGDDQLLLRGNFSLYSPASAAIYLGPRNDQGKVQSVYQFTSSGAILGGQTVLQGSLYVLGMLLQEGAMLNRGGYAAVTNSGMVGRAEADKLSEQAATAQQIIKDAKKAGEQQLEGQFKNGLYQNQQPGHDRTIRLAGFSYRDDLQGQQYSAGRLEMAESLWQQMARLGQATGGRSWDDEPAVSYQGQNQLPFPGYRTWQQEASLLQLTDLNFFDAAAGRAKDRTDPAYEEPELAHWMRAVPAQAFKVNAE